MRNKRKSLRLYGAVFFGLAFTFSNAFADAIAERETNNTIPGAQKIDNAFGIGMNPDIVNSEAWPWVSIAGTGDGTFDLYSFEVPVAGVTGVFDIDYGSTAGAAAGDMDTELFLYDASGRLLAKDDDYTSAAGAEGSVNTWDSFIQYVFEAPGTYVIAVGEFDSFGNPGGPTGNAPDPGDNYTLQVSLSEHNLDSDGDGISDLEDCQPYSDLNPTVTFQSCDSGVTNTLMDNGCTIADLILGCADDAKNHGGFTSCVTGVSKTLMRNGNIAGADMGAIQSCATSSEVGKQ